MDCPHPTQISQVEERETKQEAKKRAIVLDFQVMVAVNLRKVRRKGRWLREGMMQDFPHLEQVLGHWLKKEGNVALGLMTTQQVVHLKS